MGPQETRKQKDIGIQMSDSEKETNSEETATAKKERPKVKPNPFLSSLRDNQVAQAKEALMKTVCENPENTMGAIFEALENDADGEYIMLEIFKSLTVEELVKAAAPHVLKGWGKVKAEGVYIPYDGDENDLEDADEDDDLEDDDEFDDDGSLEDDDEPEPSVSRKSNKKKTGKKKTKAKAPSSKKKSPPKAEAKSNPSGVGDAAYQKLILKCMSEHKAKSAETAMSGKDIRDEIGGSDIEFRAAMSALRERERADVTGQARGTKYFRLPKKKD